MSKQNINCISLNVRGVRNKNKQLNIFNWLKNQKADIILLQETHLTTEMFLI